MEIEYSEWEPGDFYKTKPGYHLKPFYGGEETAAEMITRIPDGTYSVEADDTAEGECLLIKDLSNGEFALINEESFELYDVVTRHIVSIKSSNTSLKKEDTVDKNIWPHVCDYCGAPAYYDIVWGKTDCSKRCEKSKNKGYF